MKKILNNKTAAVIMMLVNGALFAQATGHNDSMNEYSNLAGAMVFLLIAHSFLCCSLFYLLQNTNILMNAERKAYHSLASFSRS